MTSVAGPVMAALEAAAATWTPERPEPTGGRGTCHLCLHRYADFVLRGPVACLPHAIVHYAVVALDWQIAEQVDQRGPALLEAVWTERPETADSGVDLDRRMDELELALPTRAELDLWEVAERIERVWKDVVNPALAAYLDRHRMTEVPWQWLL